MEAARGKLQWDGKCELLPASGLCDPAAEGRASMPTGNAYLTQAEFFSLPSHALVNGRRKKPEPIRETVFWGKDIGVSGFLSLAKPESVTVLDIFLCTGLKLFCCAPEIKSWFLLGGSKTLLTALINWATRELSPRCWQDGYSSHLHVQTLIYFLALPFMPEKGGRQRYITLNFFMSCIFASCLYSMFPYSKQLTRKRAGWHRPLFTIVIFLHLCCHRFCFSPKPLMGCDQHIISIH